MLIQRLELRESLSEQRKLPPPLRAHTTLTIGELEEVKARGLVSILMFNGLVVILAGAASYFLAGITLRPIQEMLEEQSIFISNASHELRTPIAVLRAELETAQLEKKLTETQVRELISSNLEEVLQLQELSDKLLQITQLQDGRRSRHSAPTALQDILTAAVAKIQPLARKKKITLTAATSSTVVSANSHELTECLIIILENAVKYSPEKSHITLTTHEDAKHVTIQVIDAGCGIDKKDLPHIFERFYRADASRSQTQGYGLGLSIAQKIITQHSGTLSVTSTLGSGTTVTIKLPVAK